MSIIPKEMISELIQEKYFTFPDDILNKLNEIFHGVLQESLEAKLDEKLDMANMTLRQRL